MKEIIKHFKEKAKEYVLAHFLEATIWNQETQDAYISGAEYSLTIAKEYWQQKMYSEEELISLTNQSYLNGIKDIGLDKHYEWLEQNKKK